MSDVVIVGAGRVGVACATLLAAYTPYRVAIIDHDESALKAAGVALATLDVHPDQHVALSVDLLEGVLRKVKPSVVICSTPFHVNIIVAEICSRLNCHYVDFTEDVSVTKAVTEMAPANSTFVLQTGLAPGLVNSIGLFLTKKLQERGAVSSELHMRVGALPAVGSVPEAYSLTWSSSGLINEYYQPVERIIDGVLTVDEPLDDLEELIAQGVKLEAFNTSGGMGAPKMYTDLGLKTVDYKTMRYPGHLEFLQKKLVVPLSGLDGLDRIKEGIKIVEQLFTFTRQDAVFMIVRAIGVTPSGKRVEETYHKTWPFGRELTALEYTTAGTGVAVVELLMLNQLPKGIIFGGEVSYAAMADTNCGASFMDQAV